MKLSFAAIQLSKTTLHTNKQTATRTFATNKLLNQIVNFLPTSEVKVADAEISPIGDF